MAVRVALLIVFTGLFIFAWSGDQPHLLANTTPAAVPSKQAPSYSTDRSAEIVRRTSVHDSQSEIPLPEYISGGTYLVADRFGKTTVRFVARSNEAAPNPYSPNDHYVVDGDSNRWHFIRIESPVAVSVR